MLGAQHYEEITGDIANITASDTVTLIPHYPTFQACLVNAINDARITGAPLALVYIDIDHMKHFNLHNGYQVGDVLLHRLVTLVTSLQENHLALFRSGGDKFALILSPRGYAEAGELTTQMLVRAHATLAPPQPIHCGDTYCLGPAKIGLAIGVSLFDGVMDASGFCTALSRKCTTRRGQEAIKCVCKAEAEARIINHCTRPRERRRFSCLVMLVLHENLCNYCGPRVS